MTILTRFKWFLWYFGKINVPMIGYLRPRLIKLTDSEIVIKLRLSRRSKNHLHSMYFAALATGADLAGGLHGFYHARQANVKLSLAFKSFKAQFLKRAETDVYFICEMGNEVLAMITESKQSGLRINKAISVKAYTHYPNEPIEVASFVLELSLKVI